MTMKKIVLKRKHLFGDRNMMLRRRAIIKFNEEVEEYNKKIKNGKKTKLPKLKKLRVNLVR